MISEHQCNHPYIQVNETAQYKWQFNWVEIFERLEGPFEGNLKYVLRDEAPNDRPLLDFVKPKYYLPAASHPVFELAMYKGTPRKIAYNFSNFNLDGYNPDMCYMDWPPGNLMTPCTWLSCKKNTPEFETGNCIIDCTQVRTKKQLSAGLPRSLFGILRTVPMLLRTPTMSH